MTTANKITLTRIAMIPFFIYFAAQPMLIIDETRYLAAFPTSTVIALVLFCVASFTDFLDGYVARKYNQVTDFGKFVDPLADKLLVASALILFVEQKAMAGWMVCVILARELIITSLRVVAANKGVVMDGQGQDLCADWRHHRHLSVLYHHGCAGKRYRLRGRRWCYRCYVHPSCGWYAAAADHRRLGGNAGYHLLRL